MNCGGPGHTMKQAVADVTRLFARAGIFSYSVKCFFALA